LVATFVGVNGANRGESSNTPQKVLFLLSDGFGDADKVGTPGQSGEEARDNRLKC
jgi:hypothetical protein